MMNLFGPPPRRMLMLQFEPLWGYVDDVREFCSRFTARSFDDDDLADQIGMIVHELVENAVRYGSGEELTLRLERTEDAVVVCVANAATDEGAARLREILGELSSVPPAEAYMRALRRCTTMPPNQNGLGLPRVVYEGKAELRLDVAPGPPGRISMMALRPA